MVLALGGCGTTEKDGDVGDRLEAEGLKVTVDRFDRSPPEPKSDITGLSKPGRGKRLVAAHVKACSEWGTALQQADFGIETGEGSAEPKFAARNYKDDFEAIRDDCGDGWIVFEVPAAAKPERLTFDFTDTGHGGPQREDGVEAEFSWKVE